MPSTRCGHNLDIVRRHGGSSTMVSVIVKAALLLYFSHLVAHVTGQSSCIPNFFRYIHNETSDETTGRIEMWGSPKGVPLQLSAALSITTALPTKYVGKIVLAQSREESVQAVQQGRPLKYNIYFPLRRPLPQLTSLWFNNRLVCTGPRATGQIVTSIVLNHTLYPPDIIPLKVEEVNTIPHQTNIYDLPLPPVSTRPPVRPTATPATTAELMPPATTAEPKPIAGTDQSDQECGRSVINYVNPLIAGGAKTSKGQWPWLVAIYITRRKFELQCAGTLVTNTHVVTAAHCFQVGNQTLLSGAFLVSVGSYKLLDWKESWSVRREVIKYTIHPDYQLRRDDESAGSADSDLAVLTLNKRVEYTEMIRPICLWSGPIKLDYVVGEAGVVVGWGRDEHGNSFVAEPRHISSPIVSQTVCLRSHEVFRLITSDRTLCAGKRDGTGPCNGDSGSGFVMYNRNTTRFYLRGVVSRSIKDQSTQSCDLRNYVVYVDVAKYLDWIREQISN